MKGGDNMKSNTLDLLTSLQFNSNSKPLNTSGSNYSNNSFQDILSSKQQDQRKSSAVEQKKPYDYKKNATSNAIKDKEQAVNHYVRAKITNAQSDSEQANSTNSNLETNNDIDTRTVNQNENGIDNLETNVEEIEIAVENILSLIELLGKLNDSENTTEIDIEQLTAKLEELIPQLEALQETTLGQALPKELQDMSLELFSALEELMANKDSLGLDTKNLINIKDVISKLRLEYANQNNNELNANSIDEDNNVILMNSVESSQGKADSENSKGFDKTENGLIDTNSDGANNISDTSNNQDKSLFNQTMINSQIQKEPTEVLNQIKGETAKLYNADKNDVIKQIVDKVKVDVKGENSQIKIKLKPDFLGEMSLKLSMEKGVISAKALVQDYQVKQLIESNLSQLRDNLEEQGISITNFEVSVGDDSSFERQGMNWSRQNNRRFSSLKIDENEEKYENYLDLIVDNNSSLELNELQGKRSSINLMA